MDYIKALDESLSQLMDLAKERDQTEEKMGKLHLAARGLLNLVDDRAQREAYKAMLDNYKVRIGLTDLIFLCLVRFAQTPLTPMEIRNFIVNFGSEASTQQNLLQSVHTLLKRLEESGQIKPETNKDGDKAYRLATIGERLMHRGVDEKEANRTEKQYDWLEQTLGERMVRIARGSLRRAVPPSSSFAAKAFAEEDAKKKK